MNNVLYIHHHKPDDLPVGVSYESLDNFLSADNNTIEEIMITDLLDYYLEPVVPKVLKEIINKMQSSSKLHIQSVDINLISTSLASGDIEDSAIKSILYPYRRSIHTMQDIEKLLLENKCIILNKKYINMFEYFILAEKNEA